MQTLNTQTPLQTVSFRSAQIPPGGGLPMSRSRPATISHLFCAFSPEGAGTYSAFMELDLFRSYCVRFIVKSRGLA